MRAPLLFCFFWMAFVLTSCQKAKRETLNLMHFVEEVDTPENLDLDSGLSHRQDRPAVDPLSGLLVINAIINAGEKLWNVVENNQAVTNSAGLFASAVPKGSEGMELEGFSDLQKQSFRAYGKNPFGATVYDVEYTLLHRYSGNVGGKGHFLDQVTVIPTYVKALWGYRVDLAVTASPPTNVGTADDPVGDLLLDLSIKVATLVKSADTHRVFEFRGDSPVAKEAISSSGTRAKYLAAVP